MHVEVRCMTCWKAAGNADAYKGRVSLNIVQRDGHTLLVADCSNCGSHFEMRGRTYLRPPTKAQVAKTKRAPRSWYCTGCQEWVIGRFDVCERGHTKREFKR